MPYYEFRCDKCWEFFSIKTDELYRVVCPKCLCTQHSITGFSNNENIDLLKLALRLDDIEARITILEEETGD